MDRWILQTMSSSHGFYSWAKIERCEGTNELSSTWAPCPRQNATTFENEELASCVCKLVNKSKIRLMLGAFSVVHIIEEGPRQPTLEESLINSGLSPFSTAPINLHCNQGVLKGDFPLHG